MRLHRRPLTSGLFACLLLVATACGAPETDGQTLASQTPASPPPTAPPSAEGGGTAGLPDNFPEGFPLSPEFQIVEAAFTEGDAFTQANFLVRGTSPLSVAEIAELYYGRLPGAGYDVQGQAPASGAANAVVPFGNDAI